MGKKQGKQTDTRQMSLAGLYARGKKRYLLVNGMISWGLSTGIIFLTLSSLWKNGFSFSHWKQTVFGAPAVGTLLIFMAGGLLWGLITWSMVEKQMAALQTSKKKQTPKGSKSVREIKGVKGS
ncbi:hypothetical protein [Anoxynatronum buryatiense]|uniref:Uncharacterized protein n=1 Tax=Anoxynatronum buryatiense TaxID=489973 RepID=A0AA45WYV5_9CLOT|nr:hypothetical protein [Anoxynatronum buryatiense]SMP70424.1 hypothetical protein SAMN06296020_12032 [Anoxynatronum buryatiense]